MNLTLFSSRTAKTIIAVMLFSLALTCCLTSCKKDNATSALSSGLVSEADAADAISSAVTPSTAGMVSQTQTAVMIVNGDNLACGTETDSAISGSSVTGAAVTYSYTLNWSSLMTCTNNIPSGYNFQFTGKFNYDAPRISSADSSTGSFTLSGIQPGARAYTFNSNYIREGSEVSKADGMRSFSSKISISSTNIVVDKASQKISSGTATVVISGSDAAGRSFSYSGTITFGGDDTATLVFSSGGSYSIAW